MLSSAQLKEKESAHKHTSGNRDGGKAMALEGLFAYFLTAYSESLASDYGACFPGWSVSSLMCMFGFKLVPWGFSLCHAAPLRKFLSDSFLQ